tara:strand:+ start:965 stop:1411 length:447 start_codon:yes stop_codon:yes gene_type:complete
MRIATKSSKIDISSEKKLEELAKSLSLSIKKGDIYFLHGEMGVGKTTFVKHLVNNLQLKFNQKTTEVTSPTFNIMNEYIIGDLVIKHYDLYRIKSNNELKDLNLFEDRNKEILLIEWPQIIHNKPNSITKFYFEYENEYENRYLKILN